VGRDDTSQITALLRQVRQGDRNAADKLLPLVYWELHRMAQHHFRGERGDHTLQPTALVNEAYQRLFGDGMVDWRDRHHFFAVASLHMRNLLVDHARALHAGKRNGDRIKLSLDEIEETVYRDDGDLLLLDLALSRFERLYPRESKVVELRFFCGFSEAEAAELLGVSLATLKRDWTFAKAWLFDQLGDQGLGAGD